MGLIDSFFTKDFAIKVFYSAWILVILALTWATMTYIEWTAGIFRPFSWLRELCLFLFYRSYSGSP